MLMNHQSLRGTRGRISSVIRRISQLLIMAYEQMLKDLLHWCVRYTDILTAKDSSWKRKSFAKFVSQRGQNLILETCCKNVVVNTCTDSEVLGNLPAKPAKQTLWKSNFVRFKATEFTIYQDNLTSKAQV